MPDTPPSETTAAPAFNELSVESGGPTPEPRMAPIASRRRAGWVPLAALAIATVALGVAIAGWFRPVPDHSSKPATTPAFTAQQVADAKTRVCNGYKRVAHAVAINTTGTAPPASDRIATLAVATNARFALHAGANYLTDMLATEPAIPPDLAEPIRSLSRAYQELTLIDLTEEAESTQNPVRNSIDNEMTRLDRLCSD